MIKVVSWNTGFRRRPWLELLEMDADIALLQETCNPPEKTQGRMEFSPYDPWLGGERFSLNELRPPRVVRLSDRVKVEWFEQVMPHRRELEKHQMAVSGVGTCEAARVTPLEGNREPFIVVSMYANWHGPHPTTEGGEIYSDASAHRIISDLSIFIPAVYGPQSDVGSSRHRILAAGDLNVSFRSSNAFDRRAQTILDRMSALGMEYLGPVYPNGRRADASVPEYLTNHLTEDSLDVPTYYTTRNKPKTAHVQIDHVFASRGFHHGLRTRALNGVEEWGASDHCRILIEVAE